jgi:transposase
MIRVTPSSPVMIAVEPVDFRRQMDGLIAHCRQVLSSNPMSGTLFVFINRARTMIRVLVYDGNGFWLMTKRLSKGKFVGWPTSTTVLSPSSAKALMQILQTPRAVPTSAGDVAKKEPETGGTQQHSLPHPV